MPLKIMSFNIRYGSAPDGVNAWSNRRKRLLARLREISPDLLGVQECRSDGQLQDMAAGLPGYAWYGVERGGGSEAGPEMAPVFFRSEKFRLLDHGAMWLSSTPGVPGSLSWGAVLPRTLTWVLLEYQGRRIWFGNAHFDHQGESARLRSAEMVAEFLGKRPEGEIEILTGDFNAVKNSEPYRILTGGLADPFRTPGISGGTHDGTYHGFGAVNPPEAIDWVLTSPSLRIAGARVDRENSPPYLSDHHPVVVDIEL